MLGARPQGSYGYMMLHEGGETKSLLVFATCGRHLCGQSDIRIYHVWRVPTVQAAN